MKTKRRTAARERRHGRAEWVAFLERRLHEALLGPAPLRAVVAEWEPSDGAALTNFAPGIARDEDEHAFGLLSRDTVLVPATDNRVEVTVEPGGVVGLSFELSRAPSAPPPAAEFTLYADAEGPKGLATLDALAALQAGVWDGLGAAADDEPYPRRGAGAVWNDPAGVIDWATSLPLPFAERFLRLPCRALQSEPSGTVRLRVRLGPALATEVARRLRGRLFLNHLLLGNRTVERVEPDARDGADGEPIVLQGPSPLLLELSDLRTRRHYYDHRYVPIEADPARLVRLVRLADSSGVRVDFLGHPLSRRRARLAYWRALDWRGVEVRPGETRLDLDREVCLRVRTAVHPRPSATPLLAQTRRALLALLTEPARPRYPSRSAIARAVRRELPALLRPWVEDAPRADCPLGIAVELRALPGPDDFAYPTWDIGLLPGDQAPREELAELFPLLARRVAHRLGGAFNVRVAWVEKGSNDE
jgi:hypothetical protein